MNDLIQSLVTTHDDKLFTASVIVAESFGKRHADVMRAIRKLECSESYHQRNFAYISTVDSYGRPLEICELPLPRYYLITQQDDKNDR